FFLNLTNLNHQIIKPIIIEDQNLELKNHILQYGSILGGISVVFGLMLYSRDMHYSQDIEITIISLVIMASIIVIAQFIYKKENSGFISLSRALKLGVGIGLISAIIYSLYFVVLATVLDPDTIAKSNEVTIEKMSEWRYVTDEMLEKMEDDMDNMTPPKAIFNTTSSILIVFIIISFLISLISGLFLRHNRSE
ncbi:MAG: DUF4199 domain-containing protein, partial [Flavobacteriaceae bacterium]|nr:DUF4199 domain-containing protein [Flavobacteriaceae bacterium]